MTKKEGLYAEYLQGENVIKALRGEEQTEFNVEDYRFQKKAAEYKVKELEDMLARQISRHAQAKKENDIRKFYETPEGIAYKEEMDNKRLEIQAKIRIIRGLFEKEVTECFKAYEGCKLNINLTGYYSSIQMVFGENSFHVDYDDEDKAMTANLSSMSNICLGEGDKGAKRAFYAQIGAFMNDEELHNNLKNLFEMYSKELQEQRSDLLEVNRNIKNPKMD